MPRRRGLIGRHFSGPVKLAPSRFAKLKDAVQDVVAKIEADPSTPGRRLLLAWPPSKPSLKRWRFAAEDDLGADRFVEILIDGLKPVLESLGPAMLRTRIKLVDVQVAQQRVESIECDQALLQSFELKKIGVSLKASDQLAQRLIACGVADDIDCS